MDVTTPKSKQGDTKTGSELDGALRAHTSAFSATWVFSFFINLLMLTGPLFMLQVYDRVLTSRSIPTLLALFLLVTFLFIVLGVLELVRSRILVRIGTQLEQKLNRRLFDAEMRVNIETGGGHIKALRELDVFRQFLTGPGPIALFDSPWVPAYIALIFVFHWTLGLLAIAGAVILFIIAILNEVRTRRPIESATEYLNTAAQFAEAGRTNSHALSAMGMLGPFGRLWQKERDQGLVYQAQASDRAGTLAAASKTIRLFLQSAMLALGAALAVNDIISPGTMIAASIILGRALQPVEQSISQWRGFIKARQAHKTISQILNSVPPSRKRTILNPPLGELQVKKLRTKVPGGNAAILGKNPNQGGISFGLKPGQSLGIVGASGSGKTTLAKAILGLWPGDCVAGEVLLDNVALNKWDPAQLGKSIGYLPQEVEIFGGTIKQNIARFHEDADDKSVIKAAQLAGVDKMIEGLPRAYDSDVGFLGAHLSAGQKQRVGLARALYGDPCLVVLDEPNSALDGLGQAALNRTLLELRKRAVTTIVISHRDGIIRDMEYMMFLQDGDILTMGTRPQVLQKLQELGIMAKAPTLAGPGGHQ